MNSMRLASPAIGTAKSRSRIIRLVATRPPPSRQMRARALSTASPRRAKAPERPHAARWWPRGSMVRPHRQMPTKECCESERFEGVVDKNAPVPGRGGGRALAAKFLHEGISNPWTSSSDLATVVVGVKLCSCSMWVRRRTTTPGWRFYVSELAQLVQKAEGLVLQALLRPRPSPLPTDRRMDELQGEPCQKLQRALDTSIVSAAGPAGERHHPPRRNDGAGDHWLVLEKPKWCPQRAGAPPKRGRRSATTSKRRAGDGEVEVLEKHIGAPASRQTRAAVYHTVVAKEVKKTVTPARAKGKRQVKPEATEEQNVEELGAETVGDEGTAVNGSPN